MQEQPTGLSYHKD